MLDHVNVNSLRCKYQLKQKSTTRKNVAASKSYILKKMGLTLQNLGILCKLAKVADYSELAGQVSWTTHLVGQPGKVINLEENSRSHEAELACFHHPYNCKPGGPANWMRWNVVQGFHLGILQEKNKHGSSKQFEFLFGRSLVLIVGMLRQNDSAFLQLFILSKFKYQITSRH